ncbi:hypothetical protein LAZ40_07200 [Cereibacter sphaeroides]|uniref:hypothetical protein n=1 Tax=Cereibacter sphaeroides TaxID=1063 RepID=UPI001F179155|nr:hypothetical protein [Cereibacter sphaeroides]MCE6958834.1 hypothetical protein [Cereibacter sphaeroides]MCE6973292.1 hypothetical protein [Cereibacter sphaeroides]
MSLSNDALVFALGYLNGPRAKLSFGGEGAQMAITPRARAALDELLAKGYVEIAAPSDQIPGREHYQGVARDPHIGQLAREAGIDPFGKETRWTTFEKIAEPESPAPSL